MHVRFSSSFIFCCSLLGILGESSPAQTFTTLYGFDFINYAAGSKPKGTLAVDTAGVLYGTTAEGGAYAQSICGGNGGCGTVFSLTPPASPGGAWTEAVLWSFGGTPNDGLQPYTGIVVDGGGKLYGTTSAGGENNQGTVYSLTPPASPGGAWTEAVIWSFGGTGDGKMPLANVIIGGGGVLYGTTTSGGESNQGTVFSLTPPTTPGGAWTEAVLWSFGGTPNDGLQPSQGLVADNNGVLYGTTSFGAKGAGMVFSLSPPSSPGGEWVETVLHSPERANGSPVALTIGKKGELFGATQGSYPRHGGTIFSLRPPTTPGASWKQTILWAFVERRHRGPDGYSPNGPLLLVKKSGALYGTTEFAGKGKPTGTGTIFGLRPSRSPNSRWTISVLEAFNVNSGIFPVGGLIVRDGVLYGTAAGGGPKDGGIVFSVIP